MTNHVLPDWLAPLLMAPIIGSFLGVLAMRLPEGRPVAWARSRCDSCGTVLTVRDLVPLLSFVWLRGRCRHCNAAIGRLHPIIEVASCGVAAWAAMRFGGALLWVSCGLGWSLLALTACDWRRHVLPDVLTLPLLLAGLGATFWLWPPALADHAAAAAIGYGIFRLISLLYRRLRGRDGLGAGDAKLLAAGGAWLGLAALPNLVLVAAVLGLVLAAALALREKSFSARTRIPFGPCLALATWLLWLYG